MDVDRTYLYKISRSGVFLGLLPFVSSPFEYDQEINTSFTTLLIDVDQSLDTASEEPPILTTEDGRWITTENEIPITAERSVELIGGKDSGRLIANYNDIEVVEISSDHPNGVTVFVGYIEKWQAKSGSNDIISITCISTGKDLDDYIYGTNTYTSELAQTNVGATKAIIAPIAFSQYIAQSFSGLTINLTKITLNLALDPAAPTTDPVDVTLKLFSGNITPGDTSPLATGTLLGTVTGTVTSAYPTFAEIAFIFPSVVALTGGNYYFTFEATGYGVAIDGNFDSGNPYAGGQAYYYFSGAWHQSGTDDMYFKIFSSTAVISDAIFAAKDPGNMVKDAIDGYRSQGGGISYTVSTIDLSGYTLNYTFKLATILEIIQKARELSPSDYYWFVDVATQLLYLKATLTTATHKFIIGKHLQEVQVEATVENIINVVYFSGGPTAGVNLLKKYTDVASLAVNKLGMDRLSDNRITDATTASTLGEAYIDEHDQEDYRSEVTINASSGYDISLIKLGDTVAFEGFGNFIDSVILQINKIHRSEDYVTLTLGKLPLRADAYVEQIKRDLDDQQTLANPNTPS